MNQRRAADPSFAHLHVHSRYTLLGGTASVQELAARAAAEGMSHLALTDTNALYGAIAFARACREVDVQPITGMAVTIAPPGDLAAATSPGPGLLVLLATGPEGYRSLCRLSSSIQRWPDREARAARGLDLTDLREHRRGLICISGGRRDWVERLLRAGDARGAGRFLSRLAGIFDENAYLALEIHQPEDADVAREITTLATRFGVPTVAVQPIYCLEPEQRSRLRLLAAIDHNCRYEDVPPHLLPDGGDGRVGLHWLDAVTLAGRFAGFPEALQMSAHIAAQCGPALPDGRPIWPALKLPAGQTPDEALAEQARSGARERYGPELDDAIRQRLQHELEVIAGQGFSPLFLLVADIVRFARSQDIPVSTRGSVANSLVAYCTGITTVDPIRHDLLFERFLNPARVDAPDIDLDFCSRRRDEVLEYVRRTYGEERVALVATISTMRPKSAVRETGKALGLEGPEIDDVVRRLPRGWHPDPRRRSSKTLADVVAELEDERQREVVRRAIEIVGQPHHLSVHPGGTVIAPGPMTDIAPVQWSPKGFLITQFDHRDIEAVGLPKIDLLGIRALTVLADASDLVRQHYDPAFRLLDIPLDDEATGEALSRGETIGVFQCDSTGAQRTLRQLRARTVADLAVANAFFKPGPAMGGMAQHFVRRYRGEEPVTYLHPSLEPILGHTRGVLIFQEQIMRVATELAGLDWEQANQLRRGMSKFRSDSIEALQQQFVDGCQRPPPQGPGMTRRQAQTLWEQILPFSGYGFNQGHATAYAAVSYRSAYLKVHYPAAFLCARLAGRGGFHHPAIYMAEAVRLGIPIRPPHVNRSNRRFTLTWEPGPDGHPAPNLWMGLRQVRDLRRTSVQQIIAGRKQQPFADVRDLLRRVALQAREIAHLIQCGALDGLGESRAAMLAEAEAIASTGGALQLAFDFFPVEAEPETPARRLAWEQHILGQPVSVHPLHLLSERLAGITPLAELSRSAGRVVKTAGVRLPGWTGGKGFFLGDDRTYVVAIDESEAPVPPVWQPMLVTGRWRRDEWGGGWLEVGGLQVEG